eukprot:5639934-Pleurochrysis_carterae.AAC.2
MLKTAWRWPLSPKSAAVSLHRMLRAARLRQRHVVQASARPRPCTGCVTCARAVRARYSRVQTQAAMQQEPQRTRSPHHLHGCWRVHEEARILNRKIFYRTKRPRP